MANVKRGPSTYCDLAPERALKISPRKIERKARRAPLAVRRRAGPSRISDRGCRFLCERGPPRTPKNRSASPSAGSHSVGRGPPKVRRGPSSATKGDNGDVLLTNDLLCTHGLPTAVPSARRADYREVSGPSGAVPPLCNGGIASPLLSQGGERSNQIKRRRWRCLRRRVVQRWRWG